jgi:predicted nucleotidyltransferase
MPNTPSLRGLDLLKVPDSIKKDIESFAVQLAELYGDDLISIVVFGSAVSGGYSEKNSDVNFLVIYSELNIADLGVVASLAQDWARKRRFAPRFLSRRNLLDSARYFQIDMMDMRDAHVVLCGEDLLSTLKVSRSDMHWQLAHEIKRMRMRIKQQYWRAAGDTPLLQRILLNRFSSLLYLLRTLLFLMDRPVLTSPGEIADAAIGPLDLDAGFVKQMLELKRVGRELSRAELIESFNRLMVMIRKVDEAVDGLAV